MNSRIISFIVAAFGLLAAIWIGSSVANSAWFHLAIVGLICLAVIYVSGGYKLTFYFVLFFVLLAGKFSVGFAISRDEQFLVFMCALIAVSFWHKNENHELPNTLNLRALRFTKTCLLVWITYVFLHMALHLSVYRSEGLQNIIKSYNSTFTPYIVLLYFLTKPHILPLPKNVNLSFAAIYFVVLSIATVMRVYQSRFGGLMESADPAEAGLSTPMVIGALRFVENIYTLRSIAPSGALLGVVILTSNAKYSKNPIIRLIALGLIFFAIIGAIYSGGRVALIIGILLCLAALTLRRRVAQIFIGACASILIVAFANLFSDTINTHAPLQVARSLRWILIDKGQYSNPGAENSSRWRWMQAVYAFNEWKKEPKTIFLGVGFRGISASDYAAVGFAGATLTRLSEEFAWEMGVKRVATHNMFTDLLVGYGLIGAIIYYIMLISFMSLTARLYFRMPPTSPHKDLALFTAGNVWTAALFGNISGTFFPVNGMLFMIILVAAIAQYPPSETNTQNANLKA